MKVFKGTYVTHSKGERLEAVGLCMSNGTSYGIANFNEVFYKFDDINDLIEKEELFVKENTSVIFPKVTDFFKDNIKSMSIDINFGGDK